MLEAWTYRHAVCRKIGRRLSFAKVLDAKAALALWTETANQQLLETQRSEPFLRSQAALIRATTALRLAQQELVEHFGKQYGFPTRTELDDVHRTVTELRRELRVMRREQQMAAAAPTPASPAGLLPSRRDCPDAATARRQPERDSHMTQIGQSPATALTDAAKLGAKMLAGGQLLQRLRDADVQIATTPKDLVWSQDKVSLFHFRPSAVKRLGVALLLCYGLVVRGHDGPAGRSVAGPQPGEPGA